MEELVSMGSIHTPASAQQTLEASTVIHSCLMDVATAHAKMVPPALCREVQVSSAAVLRDSLALCVNLKSMSVTVYRVRMAERVLIASINIHASAPVPSLVPTAKLLTPMLAPICHV